MPLQSFNQFSQSLAEGARKRCPECGSDVTADALFHLSTQAPSCAFGATLKVPESDAPGVALMRQLTQSLLSLSTQAQSCALRQLTSSGRVWPKLLESDARSVALPQLTHCFLCPRRHHPVFSVPHRQGGPEV